MVIQHDEINATRLVNIGLIAIFLSIAVAYGSAGLYRSLHSELNADRNIQDQIAETRALRQEQLDGIDATGEMTLAEARAAIIEANQ